MSGKTVHGQVLFDKMKFSGGYPENFMTSLARGNVQTILLQWTEKKIFL